MLVARATWFHLGSRAVVRHLDVIRCCCNNMQKAQHGCKHGHAGLQTQACLP